MVPNTPQIVTGDASGVVKIWDIRTFTCMQTFLHDDTGGNTAMNAFVCLPQEQRIITGSRKLRKFDYQKLLAVHELHQFLSNHYFQNF